MSKKSKTKEQPPLVVTEYIPRPPGFQAVEVTRENIDQVAEWLRCHETIIRRSGGVIWEVVFNNVDALDHQGKEADQIKVQFQHQPDAVLFRRQFIIRGENYISKLVSHNVLVSKYIEIPQEESIIA